jgi:hypothetical protein
MATLTVIAENMDDGERSELEDLLISDESIDRVDVVDSTGQARLDPVTLTVVAVGLIVGTGVVTRVTDWWQARSDCLLVIDARTEELKIEPRCDLAGYKGMTIILVDKDTQVTLRRTNGAFSIDEIVQTLKAGLPPSKLLGSLGASDDDVSVGPIAIPED